MKIETRCTQCGTENKNDIRNPRHGNGRKHGVERVNCTECGEETVQNRCGASVPSR